MILKKNFAIVQIVILTSSRNLRPTPLCCIPIKRVKAKFLKFYLNNLTLITSYY